MIATPNQVLVVDDERVVCQNCEKILREEGFSVTTTLTGEECLNLINERMYEAVILDLKIPDINGMELLKVIKEKKPLTTVIIITGYSSLESGIAAMKLGAADYIAKPFTPDELSFSIREALEKRPVVAGEGDITEPLAKKEEIIEPFIGGWDIIKPLTQKDELEEESRELKYSVWTPAPLKPAYFSEWAGVRIGKDETAIIVLNDLFLKLKGRVEYIDLPRVGEQIDKDTPCFRIFYSSNESSSIWMEEVCSPVSGKVIELNPLEISKINIVNEDPFDTGWLVRIVPSRLSAELKELKSRKILIVDDDEIACKSLIEYFKDDIYYIYHSENLKDLTESLKNKRYDVAILGKNVYGEAVYDAAKYIRDIDVNLPVIVVTDDGSTEFARKVREHNIFYYAMKPLDLTEINLVVKNAFMKIESREEWYQEPQKFESSRFIKNIQTVNRAGRKIAIIGLGNIFKEEDSIISQILSDRLKKMHMPVDLYMDKREVFRKEIMPYMEKNDKVIIVNGIEMGTLPGGVKKYSKLDIRINQIGYPEVLQWINAIGLDPEVVVIGIQTNKSGFGKERFFFDKRQNEEIIEEILSEVLN